jgi:FtsZ-binding cell division protein ZapB
VVAVAGGSAAPWVAAVAGLGAVVVALLAWRFPHIVPRRVREWWRAGGQSALLDEADEALAGARDTIALRREEIAGLQEKAQKQADEITSLREENAGCREEQERLRIELAALSDRVEAITARRDAIYSIVEAFGLLHHQMHMPPDVRATMPSLPEDAHD